MKLGPVQLEILANKVVAASEMMASALQRTARTLFVKEAADYACALVGLHGRIFAHPRASGVTLFVNLDATTTLAAVPDLDPGDVIVTNDAYLSGGMATHSPDITVIEPYFHDGRIVAYGWCFIHSTDVGGAVPSSIAPSLHEIFQEGLRIPPMKLMRKGVMNDNFVSILKANSRIPEENMGDVRAMLAALYTGRKQVEDIIERHGVETFLTCQDDLLDYSEIKAREVLKRLPDGVYDFWDYLDDDLVSRIPVRIRIQMTVKDGAVHLDFTGTDPEVKAAYNIATFGRLHEWFTMRFTSFLCTHDPTIVLNAGMYRPISAINPVGTVLNAEFPAAVGLRSNPARRFNDAVTGLLLKAAPDLMAAPTPGTQLVFVLAEFDASGVGRNVTILQPLSGGMGAYRGHDGVDCRDSTMSNMSNHCIEFVEADCGVIIREYDIRPDSGGAGRWRGGVGQKMTVEILRDGGSVVPRGMERMRFPAWGVAGGRPSAPFRMVVDNGRVPPSLLAKVDQFPVNKSDLVTVMMPGASGYGDPYERDTQDVCRDVEEGFVSREAAVRDYAVVINSDGSVDATATKKLRRDRARSNPDFDFGPEREAWERVFDDATMCELNRRLFQLPRSLRYETRRRIFNHAVPNLPLAGASPSLTEVLKNDDAGRARLRKALDSLLDP
jgi:N-methylhydantoinase B